MVWGRIGSYRPYKAKVGGSRPSAPTTSDLRKRGKAEAGKGSGPLRSPRLFPPSVRTWGERDDLDPHDDPCDRGHDYQRPHDEPWPSATEPGACPGNAT